jgi:hypothetical protein
VMTADGDLSRIVAETLAKGRFPPGNVYGDGKTAGRIVALLADYELDSNLLMKVNSY